jgi:hypothetical protein
MSTASARKPSPLPRDPGSVPLAGGSPSTVLKAVTAAVVAVAFVATAGYYRTDATLLAIKFISILSTAFFGVLALLVDYKDPATRRISHWGKIALFGVVLSAVLGASSEVVSNFRAQRSAKAKADEYNATIRQISRAVMPLDPKHVELAFAVPSGMLQAQGAQYRIGGVPVDSIQDALMVLVDVFAVQPLPAVLDRINLPGGPRSDFEAAATGHGQDGSGVAFTARDTLWSVRLAVNDEQVWGTRAKIAALPDLPKSLLAVTLVGNNGRDVRSILDRLKLAHLIIRFGTAQLNIPVERMRRMSTQDGRIIYTFDMPSTLDEVLDLEE